MPEHPVTYRTAHYLPARLMMTLLPGVDQGDLDTLRRDFAQYIDAPRRRSAGLTFADAWNGWIEADGTGQGRIRYTTARCPACHGRGWDTRNVGRNLARTGSPVVCGECRGTRRGAQRTQRALAVAIADPGEDTSVPTG